jgi:hypothetical protein
MEEIKTLEKAFRRERILDHKRSSANSFRPEDRSEDTNPVTNAGGVVATAREWVPIDISQNYVAITGEIAEMQGNKNLSREDQVKLANLKKYKTEIEQRIASTDAGAVALQNVQATERYINGLKNSRIDVNEPRYLEEYEIIYNNAKGPEAARRAEASQKTREAIIKEEMKNLDAFNDELQPFIEEAAKYVRLRTDRYRPTPITPKQKSLYTQMNNNIAGVIASGPQVLEQNFNIASVMGLDGEELGNLSEENKLQLSKLAYQSAIQNPNDVELSTFAVQGPNGLPEYQIRIKTSDALNIGADLFGERNTTFLGRLLGPEVGGEDEYITLTLQTDRQHLGRTRNLSGLTTEYIATLGREGYDAAIGMNFSIENNAIKTQYAGQTWNDVINDHPLEYPDGSVTGTGLVFSAHLTELAKERHGRPLTELTMPEYQALVQEMKMNIIK